MSADDVLDPVRALAAQTPAVGPERHSLPLPTQAAQPTEIQEQQDRAEPKAEGSKPSVLTRIALANPFKGLIRPEIMPRGFGVHRPGYQQPEPARPSLADERERTVLTSAQPVIRESNPLNVYDNQAQFPGNAP